MAPFLTICIPTYNRAEYLRRCLLSLTAQSGDFEIVISDNASQDETSEVVSEFPHMPIRYVRQSENVGATENFVRVIGLAEGEYVCVVTDDDWAVPGGIARLSAWLSTHQPDVMKSDLIFLSDSRSAHYLSIDEEILPVEAGLDGVRRLLPVFHVWTGLCFRRQALDYEFFASNRPKWYPHLLILGLLRRKPGYLPEPLFVHRSDSELFDEALADAGGEPFLVDLAQTFHVLKGEIDPDLMAGMSADAVRRLSFRAQHLVDVSPVEGVLDEDWVSEERRLRLILFLSRSGTPVMKGLRGIKSRLKR